jgi:hypothetical protein
MVVPEEYAGGCQDETSTLKRNMPAGPVAEQRSLHQHFLLTKSGDNTDFDSPSTIPIGNKIPQMISCRPI